MSFRHEKTVKLNLQFSNLPYQKHLNDFEFSEQPSIDKRIIDELATGRFLHEGRMCFSSILQAWAKLILLSHLAC
jgi:hypothetical protein